MAGRANRAAPEPAAFRPDQEYLLAVALSWLIPGAGHWVLGKRARGVVLGVLLLSTFWWGEVLAGGYAVTYREHPVFFYGQVGIGASAFIADRCQWADVTPNDKDPAHPKLDRKIPPGLGIGILLTSIAGLLNVLLVLAVLDPRTWEARARNGAGARAMARSALDERRRP